MRQSKRGSNGGGRKMTRLPQSWLGRVVWLMLGIALAWIAYRVVVTYGTCRMEGSPNIACLARALFWTWLDVWGKAMQGLFALFALILP